MPHRLARLALLPALYASPLVGPALADPAVSVERVPLGHVVIERFVGASPACMPEHVPLTADRVVTFFNRAKEVSSETLIRDYLWAPCKREGTLRVGGEQCRWEVYASAIGTLSCPSGTTFHACEDGRCDDLLGSTFTDNRER